MLYDIETRNDLSGAALVIRFPEEDLDRSALYTIQADWPDFLVPFRYRGINGEIECVYQLGARTKLQYRFGSRDPEQYKEFWQKALQPLLDCGDWFLKPFSFVLSVQYLYLDRDSGTICYLYVPSLRDCMEYEALKAMAAELAEQNSATDPELENRALRSIMQDFQPKLFLQMLREYRSPGAAVPEPIPIPPAEQLPSPAAKEPSAPLKGSAAPPPRQEGDIVIRLEDGKPSSKEPKKAEKPKKEKKRLFGGKKKGYTDEILLGAGASPIPAPAPASPPFQPQPFPTEAGDGATVLAPASHGPGLRLIGDPALPPSIPVAIEPGQAFTIGRFDVSIGRKESSFEFDKQTKAVSRHHAVIERDREGNYTLTDLASKAGTFLNGERLTANIPRRLATGNRISFGNAGADYIWE